MHYRGEGGPKDLAGGAAAVMASQHRRGLLRRSASSPSCNTRERAGQKTWRRRGGCMACRWCRGMLCHNLELAAMHYKGEGGPPDLAEARRLYGLAAVQGHALSQLSSHHARQGSGRAS